MIIAKLTLIGILFSIQPRGSFIFSLTQQTGKTECADFVMRRFTNRSSVGSSPHVLLVVQMCFACVVFIIIWPVTGIEEIKQLRETVKSMPVTVTYVARVA